MLHTGIQVDIQILIRIRIIQSFLHIKIHTADGIDNLAEGRQINLHIIIYLHAEDFLQHGNGECTAVIFACIGMQLCQLALPVNAVLFGDIGIFAFQIIGHFLCHGDLGISGNRDKMQLLRAGIKACDHIYIRADTILIRTKNGNIDDFILLRVGRIRCCKIGSFRFVFPLLHRNPDFRAGIRRYQKQQQQNHYQNISAPPFLPLCLSAGHSSALRHPMRVDIRLLFLHTSVPVRLSVWLLRLPTAYLPLLQLHILGRSAPSSVFSLFTHGFYSPLFQSSFRIKFFIIL